jgi:epimerase transport system membrane fusion protein
MSQIQAEKEEKIEVETKDGSIRWTGFIILFLTFGVCGTWSYFAPIDSAALAPGYVTVKFNSKTVQHLEGGIIRRLLVQDGKKVTAGDILIELDDTQIKAQKEIVFGQYVSAKALEARLLAEQKKITKVVYPDIIRLATDVRAKETIRIQNDIFNARKQTTKGERSVLMQRIEQLHSKYLGLQAQKESNQQLGLSYSEEIEELKGLLVDGFADKQHLRERQRQYTNVQGQTAELTAELASIKIQVGETKLQIIQLGKEMNEEVANLLSQVQSELYDVTEKLTAIEDRLERTLVRAPVNGTAISLMVHTEGGVISPGKPILDIVPDGEALTISAEVSPMDIDRVNIGLKAEIRFSVFNQADTPKLYGTVINLSADRLINEQTGYPYYKAELDLLPESIQDLVGLELLPGMPAEVLISTGERTLLQYLGKPISDAFARSFLEG